MTEIHRVPLQPIAKGSLTKLWLGIAVVALAAGGIAWAALPPTVDIDVLKAGSGASPTIGDVVLVNYKGTLPDGKVFDQGERTPMQMAGMIPGFTKALEQMQRGGKYRVMIPSELAYGDKGAGDGAIPPGTDLTFEIELLEFKSMAEIQQQQQMMQQLQQMQQGQGGAGAPGAAPGGPAPGELGPPPQQ